MILIGGNKQLMIDHTFIDRSSNIILAQNSPVNKTVVIQSDKPWENYRVTFNSVVDTGSKFQLYYSALSVDAQGRFHKNLCIAESNDGWLWMKPELDLFGFGKYTKTNIVAPWLAGAPSYDLNSPYGKPYTMVGTISGLFDPDGLKPPEEIEDPSKVLNMRDPVFSMVPNVPFLLSSTDGIHWTADTSTLADFACDNWSNQFFYDRRIQSYAAYLRGFTGTRRTVVRYRTDHPLRIPWVARKKNPVKDGYGNAYISDELPIVMDVDHEDGWNGDVQNPAVFPYPWAQDVYFAFPSLYRHYPGKSAAQIDGGVGHLYRYYNDGLNDIHLFCSRDGVSFKRPSRWPYVELGLWGEGDGGGMFSGLGIVRHRDRLLQYFTAMRRTHGAIIPGDRQVGSIVAMEQRLDGFVSVDASHLGGEFVTPPLVFRGNQLELNINCGALGEAWVELQEASGNPIDGFRLSECDPVDRNHLQYKVTWQNRWDVSRLEGQVVRLKFNMRLAKLYAFQFIRYHKEAEGTI